MTTPSSPLLAVVRSSPSGDGVGYVGLLLERALAEIAGAPPRVVALDAADMLRPTLAERIRFTRRLAAAQLRAATWPVVFNHLGIARAQRSLPRPIRRRYAVFLHGVEIWDPALDASRKRAVRDAALRLSNSRFTAERVMQVHPGLGTVVPTPLALLPGLPEPGDEDRRAAALLAGQTRKRVAIVGRMSSTERYKGHDALLEAWPTVVSAVPDATLFIIGTGDDAPRLAERAERIGIARRVVFTGFLADGVMRALLRICDVFAMPSRGEGFGLAYLEAMRAGLPCVGSAADAAREVIVDGATGFVVPVSTGGEIAATALASRIVTLLGDEGLRRTMGQSGRERERLEYSFERFRARLGEALD